MIPFLVAIGGGIPVYLPRSATREIPDEANLVEDLPLDTCEIEKPRGDYAIHRCDQHEVAVFWRPC